MNESIAIVVSTIGRPRDLDRLLASLDRQTVRASEIVVVDQSDGDATEGVVRSWSGRLPVERLACATRGASVGRNVGVRRVGAALVGFPDDDCWYENDALERVVDAFRAHSPAAFVAGQLMVEGRRERLRFEANPLELNRDNVWRNAIEATTFLRTSVLRDVGVFNESLGVGAGTPWGSGEGTELLLRCLAAGYRGWYTPAVRVNDAVASSPDAAQIEKVRRYSRGTGYVYRLAGYSLAERGALVGRPLAAALLALARRDVPEVRRRLAAAIGRTEGLVACPFPRLVGADEAV